MKALAFLVATLLTQTTVDVLAQSPLRYSPPDGDSIHNAISSLDPPARQALTGAVKKVYPVFIFLPGILGSKLTVQNGPEKKVIWGDIAFSQLISGADSAINYDPSVKVTAEPLDTFYAPGKDVDIYGNAFRTVQLMDAGNSSNFMRFAYDWRQSNRNSASDFADWLCQPAQHDRISGKPVVFIAHSMGGLVLKYWLEHFYESNTCGNDPSKRFSDWLQINKILFVGTPNFGAPKSILAFSQGFTLYVDDQNDSKFWKVLASIDSATLAKSLNKFGIYFPSAYELLPITNSTDDCEIHPDWPRPLTLKLLGGDSAARIDLFAVDFWRQLGWPAQLKGDERERFLTDKLPVLLKSAKDFLCDVAHYDIDSRFNVTYFASKNFPTVCSIEFTEPRNAGEPFGIKKEPLCDGDGTVPSWIASDEKRTDVDHIQADLSAHVALLSDNQFISYLNAYYAQILRKLVTTAVRDEAAPPDAVATVLAKVKYFPPSNADDSAADQINSEVGERVIDKLGVTPKQIFDDAVPRDGARKPQTQTRATAFRVYTDIETKNQRSRAWAFNNAAHIYLNQRNFLQAERLGKRALEAVDQPGAQASMSSKEVRDLKSKAALTVSVAAQRLGKGEEAQQFRIIAIRNGSTKAKRLASR